MNILYQEITSRLQKTLDLPRTTIPDKGGEMNQPIQKETHDS